MRSLPRCTGPNRRGRFELVAGLPFRARVHGRVDDETHPAFGGYLDGDGDLAAALGRRLIRLQCYEGLDAGSAVYEWNFPAQMVAIRTAEAAGSADRQALTEELFSERFLIRRPLLEAMQPQDGGPPVLLIDEIDRTDEPFEAFLLEALSDFQVTIPELGTRRAVHVPFVVLTSNSFRDMSDALKRRCLHLYIDYPGPATEHAIVARRIPALPGRLADQMITAMERIRRLDLKKKPSISETLDWGRALLNLQLESLSQEAVIATLNVICKYREDAERVRRDIDQVVNFK